MSTHFDSASASHRGAAASLLDLSELHGGSVAKARHLHVPVSGGKHSAIKCQLQR